VSNSPSLSQEDKDRIISRLGSRINKDGVLRVISQQTRSQMANRERAVERFVDLLRTALKQEKVRKKTGLSKAAKLRRLEEKRQHGILKRERSKRVPNEE
jgi:ribosome-associated protein